MFPESRPFSYAPIIIHCDSLDPTVHEETLARRYFIEKVVSRLSEIIDAPGDNDDALTPIIMIIIIELKKTSSVFRVLQHIMCVLSILKTHIYSIYNASLLFEYLGRLINIIFLNHYDYLHFVIVP